VACVPVRLDTAVFLRPRCERDLVFLAAIFRVVVWSVVVDRLLGEFDVSAATIDRRAGGCSKEAGVVCRSNC
jgi:hypothetical protein